MSYIDYTEIVRGTSLASETQVLACNFSNALNTFKGNSILISDRYKHREYKKFLMLMDKWKDETKFYSSTTQLFNNSNYLTIINLGPKTIPWILRDLKKNNTHWFSALSQLTGEDPIKVEHYGIIPRMKEDWINWAKIKNYDFD